MFSTRTALMKHLVSAEHRRLTVACPWCTGKDRTFTRISDLEVHVKACHQAVSLPKDRFSRSNGFYFAVHPKDYARIVEGITEYDCEAAYDVRKAIRSWVEGFADRKERMDRWNTGWKEGVNIAANRVRGRSRAQSENRKVQCSGEESKDGKSKTEEKIMDKRIVERKDRKRKQSESGVSHVGSGGKHTRVSVERTGCDFEAYEDDIEIGDFGGDNDSGKYDGLGQVKDNVNEGPGARRESLEREGKRAERGTGEGKEGRDEEGQREGMKKGEGHRRGGGEEEKTKHRSEEMTPDYDESASTITSSSSDSSGSSFDEADTDGIRTRAIRLLKRGAMPVCPPAKRDWTSFGNSIEMDFDGQVLNWPPANWRKLNADQRLMAHEYAAVFIERKAVKDFPQLSRRTLLDKYAFLSLDGEGRPREEEEESDKVEAKIRQYNFAYVKGIAKGDVPASRAAWTILRTLEQADRWEDTDVYTSKLDAGGVKIKI